MRQEAQQLGELIRRFRIDSAQTTASPAPRRRMAG
jgi:hypothetical protein